MEVQEFRKLVGDKFFTVTFIKKNGEERVMNGRLGVHKHTKGGTLKYNPAKRNMVVVFDRNAVGAHGPNDTGYRMLNLNALKKLSIGGKVYEF